MLLSKVTGRVGPDGFPNFFFNKGVVGEEISMAIKDFFRKGCERVQHYAHFVDLRFQGKGFLLSCLANPLAFMKLLTFSLFFSML